MRNIRRSLFIALLSLITCYNSYASDSIEGAFGLKLGEEFDSSLVMKAKSGSKKGEKYVVFEPIQKNELFKQYAARLTGNNIIWQIEAKSGKKGRLSDIEEEECEKAAADFRDSLLNKHNKAKVSQKNIKLIYKKVNLRDDSKEIEFRYTCSRNSLKIVYTDIAAKKLGEKAAEEKRIAAEKERIAHEQSLTPITGAFGITLGEKFDPSMVLKVERVWSKPDKWYKKYTVKPKEPNQLFTGYAIYTSLNDVIYKIEADRRKINKKISIPDLTRLMDSLEKKYGKAKTKNKRRLIIVQKSGNNEKVVQIQKQYYLTYTDKKAAEAAKKEFEQRSQPVDSSGL